MVVADSRAPRDGKFIERIGSYNPNTNPATVDIDSEKALEWVTKGAEPTNTVRAILRYKGVLYRKHLQVGVNKGAITQDEADKRYSDWLEQRAQQIQTKIEKLATEQEQKQKDALEREREISQKRSDEIKARQSALADEARAAAKAAAAEAAGEEDAAGEEEEAASDTGQE